MLTLLCFSHPTSVEMCSSSSPDATLQSRVDASCALSIRVVCHACTNRLYYTSYSKQAKYILCMCAFVGYYHECEENNYGEIPCIEQGAVMLWLESKILMSLQTIVYCDIYSSSTCKSRTNCLEIQILILIMIIIIIMQNFEWKIVTR